MIPKSNETSTHLGMTQGDRHLPAIQPSFAKLDDRGIEELMAFSIDYGHLLWFYNPENKKEGHWEGVFNDSPLKLIVQIINTDWVKPKNDKTNWGKQIAKLESNEQKWCHLIAFAEWILSMALQLDTWYKEASRLSMPLLKQELKSIIEFIGKKQLQKLLANDLACQEKRGLNRSFNLNYTSFSSLWELDQVQISPVFLVTKKQTKSKKIKILLEELENLYIKVMQALLALIQFARRRIPHYWEGNARVTPDLGLLYTFFRLFKHSQIFLNSITKRHLDFYYYQILKEKKKAAIPDQVFVNFEITEETEQSFQLPKGTALMAGVFDNGDDILYETLNNVKLNRIAIESLKTLFVKREKLLIKKTKKSFDYISNIFACPIANSKDGQGEPFEEPFQPWPTFGSDQSHFRRPIYGRIGWAISDPIFHLSEGKRRIELDIYFNTRSFNKNLEFFVNYLDFKTVEEAFPQLFYQAFQIRVTGAKKWFSINYTLEPLSVIKKESEKNIAQIIGFKIILPINQGKPAIVGQDQQEDFESGYDSPHPVLEIVLNPKATWYAYSFLSDLILEKIDIKVQVKQLKNHQLFNEAGPLEPEFPFYPFGEQAMPGSYLLIGNAELFQKKLSQLSLAVTWLNLPKDKKGFDAYYQAYEMGIKNDSFQVEWSALSKGQWFPKNGKKMELPLFNAPKPGKIQNDKPLSPTTLFEDLSLNLLDIIPSPQLKAPLEYGKNTKTGFLRMKFSAPVEGFGTEVYTKKFAEVVTHNAELVGTKTDNFAVSFQAEDLKGDLTEMENKLKEGLKEGGIINKADHSETSETSDPIITGNLGFSNSVMDRPVQKAIPNPPYLPHVKEISINYKASTTLFFSTGPDQTDYLPTNATIYQLYPFGKSISYQKGDVLSNDLIPSLPNDGNLFIGLQNVNAPEELSTLFALDSKIIKSTMDIPDLPAIQWKYLSKDGWKTMDSADLIFDKTNGFTNTGIIRLKIPGDVSLNTTELPAGQAWISAQAAQNTHLLSETLAILPQAAEANWKVDQKRIDQHLAKPLRPGSITALQTEVPQISGVIQAFSSFGGVLPEQNTAFYARVSERLQHKNRAIRAKDYEYLLLEYFPFLFQVKVVSPLQYPQYIKPGKLLITAISKRNEDFIGKRPPQVSFSQLKDINQFIQSYTSPFVTIEIGNPLFEKVKVIADIVFEETGEEGKLLKKLNQEITDFISPWLKSTDQYLDFEQVINVAEVAYFINSRTYVNQVYNFSMVQIIHFSRKYRLLDTINKENQIGLTELKASKPYAILISVKKHELKVFPKSNPPKTSTSRKKAIGTMIINRDFILSSKSTKNGKKIKKRGRRN